MTRVPLHSRYICSVRQFITICPAGILPSCSATCCFRMFRGMSSRSSTLALTILSMSLFASFFVSALALRFCHRVSQDGSRRWKSEKLEWIVPPGYGLHELVARAERTSLTYRDKIAGAGSYHLLYQLTYLYEMVLPSSACAVNRHQTMSVCAHT